MIGISSESTESTSDKTEDSAPTKPNFGDTNNVLTSLKEAQAPVSVTLTIDRSVGKIAAWVIGLIVSASLLIGAGCVLCVWMIISYQHSERETELLKYYVLEMDAKLIASGVKKPDESVAGKMEKAK